MKFMEPWYFQSTLFKIGSLQVHWYGLMYAMAFLAGYVWFYFSKIGKSLKLKDAEKDTLLLGAILGVLLGGRIGYILFYNLPFYISNPLKIFAVWEGGMSFHGGVLGVGVALFWFSRRYKIAFLKLADLVTGIAPLGLFFGRIGNFVNGELYGRVAQHYCLYFPADPLNCRYPSQLAESLLEGLLLFIILYCIGRRTQKTGVITSFFLIFYGIFRFLIEFFREPDAQIGYIFKVFTLGQFFCALMVLSGGILLFALEKKLRPFRDKRSA